MSSILMASSCILSGIESVTPYASTFTISTVYLALASLSFAYLKLKDPTSTRFPWYTEVKQETRLRLPAETTPPRYEFNFRVAFKLVCGALCEFFVSMSVIMGFSAALKGNLNQGLGTALMNFNAVIVTGATYILYDERINYS